MKSLSTTLSGGFAHYFRDFRERVHALSQTLNEEQFWRKPYPYGNSVGNLVLHLTGNLNYYIGAQIENTGYVRDRELEFTDVQLGKKQAVLQDMDAAIEIVIQSIARQSDEDWSREYSAVGVDDVPDRFNMYLRCCVHFHHHIGQVIYLVKELTR